MNVSLTDAMVEAALGKWFCCFDNYKENPSLVGGSIDNWRTDMRAALTEALALMPKGADFRAGAEMAAGIAAEHGGRTFEATSTVLEGEPRVYDYYDACEMIESAIRTALAALPEGGERNPTIAHAGALDAISDLEGGLGRWTCAARKQGTAGGNDPADCNWPVCGCDLHADKVIAALQESGNLPFDGRDLGAALSRANEMLKGAHSAMTDALFNAPGERFNAVIREIETTLAMAAPAAPQTRDAGGGT